MNGDAAEEVVRMALNGADISIRLVGAGAKNLAGLSEPPTVFAMPYADYLLSVLLFRACTAEVCTYSLFPKLIGMNISSKHNAKAFSPGVIRTILYI